MALEQSALLEDLASLKTAEVDDKIRAAGTGSSTRRVPERSRITGRGRLPPAHLPEWALYDDGV